MAMIYATHDALIGAQIPGQVISNLRFADDIVLIAENANDLLLIVILEFQSSSNLGLIVILEFQSSSNLGLKINISKKKKKIANHQQE